MIEGVNGVQAAQCHLQAISGHFFLTPHSTMLAWNQPWWEHLHHRNRQMLQTRFLFIILKFIYLLLLVKEKQHILILGVKKYYSPNPNFQTNLGMGERDITRGRWEKIPNISKIGQEKGKIHIKQRENKKYKDDFCKLKH